MSSVDERIVEMRFDNKEFEPGAKTTLSTLEKLKEALKFDKAGDGLSKLDSATKGIDVSKLTSGIEALQNRFSTLGIVGMRVISNLTDSMMNLASKGVSFLTSGILQGGYSRASNIENAKFQIQGLGYEWGQLEKQIDFAVNQTAYGLDSAAKAASTLLASGVEISDTFDASAGNLDQMGIALRAISGVAAQTNSDYDSIAHIFETVAGNGRLMGDQLNQLAYRGMNVAATLGKALGKSESEIRDMVSKSQISFEQFSQIMYDAFGEHAVKANETFTGSLSNVRAALARIGQAFYTPLIKQNGPLVEFFNALRLKINEIKNAITQAGGPIEKLSDSAIKLVKIFKDLVEGIDVKSFFSDISKSVDGFVKVFDNSITIISNTASAIKNLLSPIKKAFKDAFPKSILDVIVNATSKLAEFTEGFLKPKTILKKPVLDPGDLIPGDTKTLYQTNDIIKNLTSVASGLFGVFRIGASAVKAVYEALKPVITYIKDLGGGFLETAAKVGDAIKNFADFAEETDFFGKKIQNVIDFVRQLIDDFKYITGIDLKLPTWDDLVSLFENAVNKVKEYKDAAVKFVEELWAGIKYVFGIEDLEPPSLEDFKNAFESAKKKVEELKLAIEHAKTTIGDFFTKLHDDFQKITGIDVHIPSLDELKSAVDSIKKLFEDAKIKIREFLDTHQGLVQFIDGIKTAFSNFHVDLSGFTDFISGVGENLSPVEKILGVISNIIDFIFRVASNAIPVIAEVATKVWEFAKKLWDGLKELFTGGDMGASLKNTTLAVAIFQVAQVLRQLNKLLGKGGGGSTSNPIKALAGAFSQLKDTFFEWQKSINASYYLKLGAAILMIAIAINTLSKIDTDKLIISAGAVYAFMTALKMSLNEFSSLKFNKGFGSAGLVMLEFATSLLIVASAAKTLASLDLEGLAKGIGGVSVLMWEMTAVAKTLSGGKNMMKGLGGLLTMAVAIRIIASSMKALGKMDLTSLLASFIAISALMQGMTAIAEKLSGADRMMKGLSGLLVMAISIKVLTSAMKSLAKLDLTSLLASFVVISALVQGLTSIAIKLSGANRMMKGLSGLLIMAVAVKVLASAMKSLGKMDFASLLASFLTITILMQGMTSIAIKLQGTTGGLAKAAAGFLIMSVAINAIAIAMRSLGKMDAAGIMGSLLMLGGTLALLVVAMDNLKGGIKSAATLAILADALIPLAFAMKLLGSLNIQQVATSLIMLFGTLTILGVASAVLSKFVPEMLALAGSFAVFAAGAALMGVAAMALAAGLAALGPAINLFVTGVASALYQLVANVGNASVELVVVVGKLLVALFEGIADAAYAIKDAAVGIITALCQAIVETLPVIVTMGAVVIASFLEGIGRNIKRIVIAAVTLVVNFLDGVSKMMPVIANAGMQLIVSFINGMADAIRTSGGDLIMAMSNLMGALIEFALTALQTLVRDIPVYGTQLANELEKMKSHVREKFDPAEAEKLGSEYTKSIAKGMEDGSDEVEAAGKHTGVSGSFALQDNLFGAKQGKSATQQLASGITEGGGDVLSMTEILGQGALSNLDISDQTGQLSALSMENYTAGFEGVDLSQYGIDLSGSALSGIDQNTPEYAKSADKQVDTYAEKIKSPENKSKLEESWDEIVSNSGLKHGKLGQKEIEYTVDQQTSTYVERHRNSSNKKKVEQAAHEGLAVPSMVGAEGTKEMSSSADKNATTYANTLAKGKSKAIIGGHALRDGGASGAKGPTQYSNSANTDAGGFYNTMSNGYNKSKTSASGRSLAGAGASGARAQYSSFVSVGSYLTEGLRSGISSKIRELRDTATHAVRTTMLAMKSAAREQSPSKETMEIGSYMSEGLIIGLLSLKSQLEKAGTKVTESSLNGINSVTSTVSDLVNNGLNIDPTIRPVLDASGIQNGLTQVDGLLNTQRSMALAAGVSFNQTNVGPTLEQQIGTAVNNALNKIYDKIEEASAKTPYQINVPLNIDKRTFARATATVTREELDRIDYFNNRKAGIA